MAFERFNLSRANPTEMKYVFCTDSANTTPPRPHADVAEQCSGKLMAPKNSMQVSVNSGDTVNAGVRLRKDGSYTGAQPRLIVRTNGAIGINSDMRGGSDVTMCLPRIVGCRAPPLSRFKGNPAPPANGGQQRTRLRFRPHGKTPASTILKHDEHLHGSNQTCRCWLNDQTTII
jgi:hypothetical protein